MGFLLFTAVIAFSIPQTGHSLAAAAARDEVTVINTTSQPIPVSVQGTAKVAISNQPTVNLASNEVVVANQQPIIVQPARQPFRQFVTASITPGGEDCELLVIPEGKRLTIESFSADATSGAPPNVYLVVHVQAPDGDINQRRSVMLDMRPRRSNTYSGHATTLLHSGSTSDSLNATFSYMVCVAGNNTPTSIGGFVTGWLE